MRGRLANIYRLGIKELFSLRYDAVMVFLIVYAFTYAIYAPARQASTEVHNAAVAIVDEDVSPLSRRIRDALLPPHFLPPVPLTLQEVDAGIDLTQALHEVVREGIVVVDQDDHGGAWKDACPGRPRTRPVRTFGS